MNEKEIIEQLEKACILDENCYEVDCLSEKDLEAIRGLYKLYLQQKEKNIDAILSCMEETNKRLTKELINGKQDENKKIKGLSGGIYE